MVAPKETAADSALPVFDGTRSPDRVGWGSVAMLLGMCAVWGLNFVSIQVGNRGLPPLFASAIRSTGATVLIAIWAALFGKQLLVDRRRLLDGLIMGGMFTLEFLFLYWGSSFTSASRSVLLVYTSPFWVAIGAHFLLRDDRLTWVKVAGLGLSFAGVAAVFRAPSGGLPANHLVGDGMEVLAAVFWALTTLFVKHTMRVRPMSTFQVLFYQLAFSVPLLWLGALVFEHGEPLTFRLDSSLALLYQTVIVATVSYLLWFWLMRTQKVSSLHSFTFFTPLFGVIFGGLLLGEHLPLLLWLGLGCVAGGTYLVNTRQRFARRR